MKSNNVFEGHEMLIMMAMKVILKGEEEKNHVKVLYQKSCRCKHKPNQREMPMTGILTLRV